MDLLNSKLYQLFVQELMNLNIGYELNKLRISRMIDIIQAIDYIQYGDPSKREIKQIINIIGGGV